MQANRTIPTLLFTILILSMSFSQESKKYNYNDGPYINYGKDSTNIFWITGGKMFDTTVVKGSPLGFNINGLPSIDVENSFIQDEPFQNIEGVEKYIALSDIHGQYDVFIKLLRSHNVIDKNLKWSYGKGHLIIVGDVLDRGPKVTETLWLLYGLEKQAKAVGGKVHMLLGNHELMVMEGNIGYINPKYRYTSGISQIEYSKLFGADTELGRWLRSKNIAAIINGSAFVHGGFSLNVLEKESSIEKLNHMFKNKVMLKGITQNDTTDLTSLLYFENGPLWYRGYANPKGFDEAKADRILKALNVDRVIVGHTSMPRIVSIHDEKIILVDSSIKFGRSGEILIYQQDSFYRGQIDGSILPINKEQSTNTASSPFQYVYQLEDTDLTIVIDTDLKRLMGKERETKEYVDGSLVAIHNLEFNREWEIRLKTRGNMRKKVCRIPPLKIDFSKSNLDNAGFYKNDKLKLVLPCSGSGKYQQPLFKEHIIYKLYQEVDSLGFRTQLVNVILEDKGKEKYNLTGFFVEDEDDYTLRTNGKIITKGVVRTEALNRDAYLKMMFFQYMILNTDFGISNKHNLEMVKLPGEDRVRAIPYDFDYAGFVDQDYAVPHESMDLIDVREPLFRGRKVTESEVMKMKEFFNLKRTAFEKIILDALFLSSRSKKQMLKDIESFYKRLNNKSKWKKTFYNKKK